MCLGFIWSSFLLDVPFEAVMKNAEIHWLALLETVHEAALAPDAYCSMQVVITSSVHVVCHPSLPCLARLP